MNLKIDDAAMAACERVLETLKGVPPETVASALALALGRLLARRGATVPILRQVARVISVAFKAEGAHG